MSESEVEFTDHARRKISMLARHGFRVTETVIVNILEQPESVQVGHGKRRIAQAAISERHVLRVVYESQHETKRVITVYPGRRDRYE